MPDFGSGLSSQFGIKSSYNQIEIQSADKECVDRTFICLSTYIISWVLQIINLLCKASWKVSVQISLICSKRIIRSYNRNDLIISLHDKQKNIIDEDGIKWVKPHMGNTKLVHHQEKNSHISMETTRGKSLPSSLDSIEILSQV